MNLLVIGYGNELRGDDGVGPCVARTVEEWGLAGVVALTSHGLTPELAEPISLAENVVFVDARVGGVEVDVIELKPGAATGIGHSSEPRWLLSLVESLWDRLPRAWLITVPGIDFGMGEGLSTRAEQGIVSGLRVIRTLAEMPLIPYDARQLNECSVFAQGEREVNSSCYSFYQNQP